jgi:hypothetical protein
MNERPIALGWRPETERKVAPRRDAVDAPMTDRRQARALLSSEAAADPHNIIDSEGHIVQSAQRCALRAVLPAFHLVTREFAAWWPRPTASQR